MPKFRSIHTKIVQSFDFNEMPDDFTRLMWVLLPLGLDGEGRGIYSAAWIKAKVFPMREDVSNKKVTDAMEWYTTRGMVQVYTVDSHDYFAVTKFKEYQRGFEKESPSVLPEPVKTNSVPTPDQLQNKSPLNTQSQSQSQSDSNANVIISQPTDDVLFVGDFLRESGIRELSDNDQGYEIVALRDKHGYEKMMSAAAWLKEKRITKIEKALSSLRTALPDWVIPVKKMSTLDQSLAAIRAFELEAQDAVV